MGKTARALTRLLGKKVLFQGRFGWGERERLTAMAEAQQGTLTEKIDATVDYVVLADLSGGKTVQQKALSLNAKGASIQVLDSTGFQKLVEPTPQEVLELMRGGSKSAPLLAKVLSPTYAFNQTVQHTPEYAFAGESFDKLDLSGMDLTSVNFTKCSFNGAKLDSTFFSSAVECDFRGAEGKGTTFGDVTGSRFAAASFPGAEFSGSLADASFESASLEDASFECNVYARRAAKRLSMQGVAFKNARLHKALFRDLTLQSTNFEGADLSDAAFLGGLLETPNFRKANLRGANLFGDKVKGADFSEADLTGANLSDTDLAGCTFKGADLTRCNLRGSKMQNADLTGAKNYDPHGGMGSIGPALKEMDTIVGKARRIQVEFRVSTGKDDEGETVGIDSSSLKYGYGIRLPMNLGVARYHRRAIHTFSDAMLELAMAVGSKLVRYETLDVTTTKSPVAGKELRELALKGIAEAFGQPVPPEEELAAATKTFREQRKEQSAADRERREKAREEEEKRKAAEKKQISKQIAKQVGKVTDIATFLKALELRIEKPKIDKATKMLKAERFKLFNDVGEELVSGVVKSQTDPDLVYACRIGHDGHYSCCTQNLNICGGLRGSICKHLLVLIIGLVKAGELDPTTIDAWVAKTQNNKAELDKEAMGAIFIKYKGAEAGEVDWRPTETLPEDYYSL